MNVPRVAPWLACLILLSGCGAEQTSLSETESEARVVVRAELRPGSSGEDGAALADKYSKLASISGAKADGGDTLTLFVSPQATDDEVEAVRQVVSRDSRVEKVKVERRK